MAALPGGAKWLAIMFTYNFIFIMIMYIYNHPGGDELSLSSKNKKLSIFGFQFPFFGINSIFYGWLTFNSKVMGKLKIRW